MTTRIELFYNEYKDEENKTHKNAFIQFRDIKIIDGKEVYHRSVLSPSDDLSALPEECDIIDEGKMHPRSNVSKHIKDWKKRMKDAK